MRPADAPGLRPGYALLLFLLAWFASPAALAHPLAPALLDVRETAPSQYAVTWRTSVIRAQGSDVAPRFPDGCTSGAAGPAEVIEGAAIETRWTVACEGAGLAGQRLSIDGLTRSGINAVVRIELAGAPVVQRLLDAGDPLFVVPRSRGTLGLLGDYVRLGIEHLATGVDHLLFVAGLVLLVRRVRALVVVVTAFTLGHSVTLALAVLGIVRVDPRLTEIGIALTLLVLACEVARPRGEGRSWLGTHPGAMAAGFGLIHGLGFAGALSSIGLPAGAIPLALFGFNLGIECAQLVVVLALVGGRELAARVIARSPAAGPGALPAYTIGTLAAYSLLQRMGDWLT